ncbi:MAG: FAD-binding protein [Gammaproteobacteria bacterium]|nr:FAD-binding protein [Gammaproteobacteria bacterium]
MTILVIAEHDQQALKRATYQTMAAALQLGDMVDILVIGDNCDKVNQAAAKIKGAKRILAVDAKEYTHQLAENIAPVIAELGAAYTHILAPATTFGKNILPRVAALMNVAMISDVIKIVADDTFVRPIYAGNALATVQSKDPIKLLTVRTTAFQPTTESDSSAPIEIVTKSVQNDLSEFVSEEIHVSARPELTAARIIIAGGRGLKSAENFKLLEKLADQLGAAIGASRAAVDAGFAPNDSQVGQTGKVVAPDLYIAIGISGAIQHLAGMKDSKVIVAINNDPDAPIFEIADYGLVADLFTAIAELQTELERVT